MKGPKIKSQEIPNVALSMDDCIGKTVLRLDGKSQAGINVETHCRIVGAVANELISRMPEWLQKSLFPKGSSLLSAMHDVGKISPTFQEKIRRRGITGYQPNSFPGLERASPELERNWRGHVGVSQASVEDKGKYIPEILGMHHGYTPNHSYLASDQVFGGKTWQARREELYNRLAGYFHEQWPEIRTDPQSSALAGLTTVSDWIGSGDIFNDPKDDWEKNIPKAVDAAGFLNPEIEKGLSFNDIFDKFNPRPIQKSFVKACDSRGLYILEAPMGIGKTEAALYAAYKSMENGQSRGIYFALPTQLTSNKIWERMSDFLKCILKKESPNCRALLLHGNAWLRESVMGVNAEPGMSWFNSSKRGILAPFAVGTIDQALMAVMNVKHGFVRAFGLAGKVVILDEIHTYDSYTGTILDCLVKVLQELGCTIIILSATLTRERRNAIAGIKKIPSQNLKQQAYPLISIVKESKDTFQEIKGDNIPDAVVNLQISSDEDQAIKKALAHGERGEQVLWIENTVADAQNIYNCLAARSKEIGLACGLLHSRFIKIEREENESRWVGIYGKDNISERKKCGHILIGTQVLEQSLDIDADFLITRLCPSDMLFQRFGRLWRHRGNDKARPSEATRSAWVLTPSIKNVITDTSAFEKSKYIYPPYILCRTLEVWHKLKTVSIPGQIRPFIEATYAERTEKGKLAEYKHELEKKRETLRRIALIGVSSGGKTLPESKATTRYSEIDNIEVLLISKIKPAKSGVKLVFLDDSSACLPERPNLIAGSKRREISAQILLHTVSVPEYMAPALSTLQKPKWIKGYVYMGDENENPFRIALVAPSGEIKAIDHSETSSKYQLDYSNEKGYTATKRL